MLGFLKIRYVWWISCITSWWRWGYYDFFAERPFWRICFRPAAAWKILLGSDMQRWDLHGEEKCIHFFFGHFVSGCYQISSALTQCFEISQKALFCEVTIFAPKPCKLTQLALVEIRRDFFVPFSNTVKNMNILLENEGKGKKVSRLIM